jgi:hypothetical protein
VTTVAEVVEVCERCPSGALVHEVKGSALATGTISRACGASPRMPRRAPIRGVP